jgi:hypothetical protein
MRKSLLLGLVTLSTFLFPTVALASFAPADRETFRCVTKRSCPGPTFVTFNSFIDAPGPDAPSGGDERAFFEARPAGQSGQTGFSDPIAVQDGQQVELKVYIHNDGNPNLMGTDAAAAQNTNVSIQLPNGTSGTNSGIAYISANNARPRLISDTLDFTSSRPVNMTFDTNSPVNVTRNDGKDDGDNNFTTTQANNAIFTQTNSMSINLDNWPGGFASRGWLTVMATAHVVPATTTVQPVFACTSLLRGNVNNNQTTFTATTNGEVAGATIATYNFTVKGPNGQVVDSSTVNTSAQSAVYNFNQSTPGTYTVSAVAVSDKGTTSSATCTQQITVAQPTATLSASTTVQPTPTLPNTGASGVVGIFTGVSALGTAGHYAIRRHRR